MLRARAGGHSAILLAAGSAAQQIRIESRLRAPVNYIVWLGRAFLQRFAPIPV